VPLPEGAFHDYYYGGWQEILPSARLGFGDRTWELIKAIMAEVSLLPFEAAIAEDTQERVAVHTRVRLYRSPLERTLCH